MKPLIFIDMDMVLVDLKKGIQKLDHSFTNDNTFKVSPSLKEKIISKPDFWATLPKMNDFDELWEFVSLLNPKILTANTIWDNKAKEGKWEWIQRNCPAIPNYDFYCVLREEKQIFATTKNKRNILIDDYQLNCDEWNSNGGVAIHHKNAQDTIKQLKILLNL